MIDNFDGTYEYNLQVDKEGVIRVTVYLMQSGIITAEYRSSTTNSLLLNENVTEINNFWSTSSNVVVSSSLFKYKKFLILSLYL